MRNSNISMPKAGPPMAENSKQIRMTKIRNSKQFDFKDATIAFVKNVRSFNKNQGRIYQILRIAKKCNKKNVLII